MTEAELTLFARAAVALGIGLLIGLERGWQSRAEISGSRVAGIRTFGLLGIMGAIWWYLGAGIGDIFLGLSFLGIVVFLAGFYYLRAKSKPNDMSVTSLVAAILTFMLGGLAMHGQILLASAIAVAVTILLSTKDQMHALLRRVERKELAAVFKLLIMTVILLPVLPDENYGPYGVLNPFDIWLIVIFIAALSYTGYLAVRFFGNRRGILVASLAGGLVSSTIVTLTWARILRSHESQWRMFAGGIIAACAVMFLRVLVIIAVLAPSIMTVVALPLILASLITFAAVALIMSAAPNNDAQGEIVLNNPFDLRMAFQFGVLLIVVLVLIAFARDWMGRTGIYFLAFLTGILDVDAATASFARYANEGMAIHIATNGIATTLLSNSLFKIAAAWFLGGYKIGLAVFLALSMALGGAAASFLLLT